MSNKIEGIPDGYALVRVGTPKLGESYLDCIGNARVNDSKHLSNKNYAIIRSIMRVQVGKWYKDSVGNMYGPMRAFTTISPRGDFYGTEGLGALWYSNGEPLANAHGLIEEVPAPAPKYRPFSTNEFKQHRDKWFKLKNERILVKVSYYDDSIVQFSNGTGCYLGALHENATFEDGTPAGVLECS